MFSTEMTPQAVANEVIENILDSMFPAEKAAADALSVLLDSVDKVIKSRGIIEFVLGYFKIIYFDFLCYFMHLSLYGWNIMVLTKSLNVAIKASESGLNTQGRRASLLNGY